MSAKKDNDGLRFKRQMTRIALLNALMQGHNIVIEGAKKRPRTQAKEKVEKETVEKIEGKSKPGKPKPAKPGSFREKKDIEKAKGLAPSKKQKRWEKTLGKPQESAVPIGEQAPFKRKKEDESKLFQGMSEAELATKWSQKWDEKRGQMVPNYADTYTGSKRGRIVPAGDQLPGLWFVEVQLPGRGADPTRGGPWLRIHEKPTTQSRARKLAIIASAVAWKQDPLTGNALDDKQQETAMTEVQRIIKNIDSEAAEPTKWAGWDMLSRETQNDIILAMMREGIAGGQVSADIAQSLMDNPKVKGGDWETRLKRAISLGKATYRAKTVQQEKTEEQVAKENAEVTEIVERLSKAKVPDPRTGKKMEPGRARELYYEAGSEVEPAIELAKKQNDEIKRLVLFVKNEGITDVEGHRLKPTTIADIYFKVSDEVDEDVLGEDKASAERMLKTLERAKAQYTSKAEIARKKEEAEAEKKERARAGRRRKEKEMKSPEELAKELEGVKEKEAPLGPATPTGKPAEIKPGGGRQIGLQTWEQFINNPRVYDVIAKLQGASVDPRTGIWPDEKEKAQFQAEVVPQLRDWIQGTLARIGADISGPTTTVDMMNLKEQAESSGDPLLMSLGKWLGVQVSFGDPFAAEAVPAPYERPYEEPPEEEASENK